MANQDQRTATATWMMLGLAVGFALGYILSNSLDTDRAVQDSRGTYQLYFDSQSGAVFNLNTVTGRSYKYIVIRAGDAGTFERISGAL